MAAGLIEGGSTEESSNNTSSEMRRSSGDEDGACVSDAETRKTRVGDGTSPTPTFTEFLHAPVAIGMYGASTCDARRGVLAMRHTSLRCAASICCWLQP